MHRLTLTFAFTFAALAATEDFPTAAGTLRLTPVQHASLYLQAGGKVLYIDPAQGSYDGLPAADYILITDIHGDHLAGAIVDKLKKAGTLVWGPQAVCAKLTPAP